MHVRVTFFGPLLELAELSQLDKIEIEIPEGITYTDALNLIVERWPVLSSYSLTLAGDGTFLKRMGPLPKIKELAVFPPFAGG